jgi:hypothetical protein
MAGDLLDGGFEPLNARARDGDGPDANGTTVMVEHERAIGARSLAPHDENQIGLDGLLQPFGGLICRMG